MFKFTAWLIFTASIICILTAAMSSPESNGPLIVVYLVLQLVAQFMLNHVYGKRSRLLSEYLRQQQLDMIDDYKRSQESKDDAAKVETVKMDNESFRSK